MLLAGGLLAWGTYSVKQSPLDVIPDLSETWSLFLRSGWAEARAVTYPLVSNLLGISIDLSISQRCT